MQLIYSDVCAPAHHRSIDITCPSAKDMESVKSVGCPKIWWTILVPCLSLFMYPISRHAHLSWRDSSVDTVSAHAYYAFRRCECLGSAAQESKITNDLIKPITCLQSTLILERFYLNLNILQLSALLRRDFLKRIQIPIFPSLASCAKQVADSVGFLSGFSEQLGFHRI